MKLMYENAISQDNASWRSTVLLSCIFTPHCIERKRSINQSCLASILCVLFLFIPSRIYACSLASVALLHSLCLALVDKPRHKKRHLLHSIAVLYSGYEPWLVTVCLSQVDYARGYHRKPDKSRSLLYNLGIICRLASCPGASFPSFLQEITFSIRAWRAQAKGACA